MKEADWVSLAWAITLTAFAVSLFTMIVWVSIVVSNNSEAKFRIAVEAGLVQGTVQGDKGWHWVAP